ncbi:multidrug resistance protein 2 [Nannizzia gypsea CBS 118893]|uniref:Multidrug resistance protein 2 n=1 Tax=Arthroderma gypseum (strain ATCC MYA-4604 / CBS 118893) TaxID=535722 RepID=E4V734_ARTGP|nr:multidrug resistance protein 2 [Nannizzia gypsea CBS 118893]EFQ96900.1 multidrug resistance protein 2 [Nannizzia gypsea CBS 118893]
MAVKDKKKKGKEEQEKGEDKKEDKKEEEEEEKAPFSNLWRIFSYGTKADLALMGLAFFCSAGAGIALPLMNIVFGALITDFNNFFLPDSTVSPEDFRAAVNKNVLFIVYLFIGKFVLSYVSMFCLRTSGIRISANLRLAYLKALFRQPVAYLDAMPVGRPTDTITASSNLIQAGISDRLAVLVQSAALVIAAYAVAFSRSWSLTLVSSSCLLFILLIYSMVIPFYLRFFKAVEAANERATSVAGEALSSIRTVVACGAQSNLVDRHAGHIADARRKGLQISPVVGLQLGPTNFAMYCNFALTFWFGVKQFTAGNVSDAGPVATVIFSVIIVVSAVSFIANPIIALSKAIAASARYFSVIDAPPVKTDGIKDIDVASCGELAFKDVTFSYPTRPGVTILDNLSLVFPTGKVTALVGPSGCGKSTIIALLERWYQLSDQLDLSKVKEKKEKAKENEKDSEVKDEKNEPDNEERKENAGSIMIGPHCIDELDLKWWRSQIGLVQQEPFSFNTSIFRNVAFGLVGSQWENEPEDVQRQLVVEACREAFADEFIEKLPEKYDTMIGENGIKLSGGQRQRLAIARSIIKRPLILILDEATSAIDVRGERIVQEALDRVSKGRTTITIAHRLSTIKKADKIIVLRKGTAIESGTHEELLAQEGLYHSLVHNQQLDMDEDGNNETVQAERETEKDGPHLSMSRTKSTVQDTDLEQGLTLPEEPPKELSLFDSVGVLLWEQRKYWILYVGVLIGAAGCGAGYSIQSYLFSQLITVFQLTGSKLVEKTNFWSLMFFVLALAVAFFYFILGWMSMSISTYVSTTYRQEYFDSMIRKPIAFFDKDENSAGSLTSRISSDSTQLQELLGPTMAFPIISVFNVIGCIAISFAFGWKLTLVAIFSAFPLIIIAMFVRVRYEVQFDKMNAAVFEESSQFASEAFGAFRTVTSLTLEGSISERYSGLLQNHVRSAFVKARVAALVFAASDSMELPCMALCFWYGGQLLSTHEYDVLQFFVIYIAVVLGGQAAGHFGSISPNLAQAKAAANRIMSIRPAPDDNKNKAILSQCEGGVEIEFKSVDFTYPSRDVPVFKNLSFTVGKGQFAALVGPSGCGKTSVISILERFYDYQGGHIRLNGTELSSLDLKPYRQTMSLVSQEPTLYQGTIRDNITLGIKPDAVTTEQVHQACRDAEIHDFIASLPDGYNTQVGQKGLALSGGQKQRICIARALIRNPHLLLLDEATSSLDSESEKSVQAAIERTAKGRTVLVVAHRLATVQNADVIFVFGDGGIVESGSHHSLLKKRGVYYQMCESQALDR